MYIAIDPRDKTPTFEQIKRSITSLIVSGDLGVGARLPPIRQLAGDLQVAPNTVARAYRELEDADLVHSSGRRGTIVAEPSRVGRSDAAAGSIESAIRSARASGLDAADIMALVRRILVN